MVSSQAQAHAQRIQLKSNSAENVTSCCRYDQSCGSDLILTGSESGSNLSGQTGSRSRPKHRIQIRNPGCDIGCE